MLLNLVGTLFCGNTPLKSAQYIRASYALQSFLIKFLGADRTLIE